MEDTLVHVQGLYYNNLSILYVGEGDFSFSSSHATRFGNANNIVATSLDSRDVLKRKYGMNAIQNIKNLTDRGAQVIHCVNARNMAEKDGRLPLFASGRSRFDVVNYNFPHAGFFGYEGDPKVVRKHTELMQGFFRNAALLLAPGGVVYVAHKRGPSYDSWNLEENANMHGLQFVGSVPFRKKNFPGYKNRRGSGDRAGETFELGKAAIYKFALRRGVWIKNIEGHGLPTPYEEQYLLQTLSNLRSFTGGGSKTPLLQAMAAEVARLEKEKLGPKKQIQLSSLKMGLKVGLKVVPLLVKTLAIHQIQHLQAPKSCKKLAKSWSKLQKLALEAMEDQQHIEHENLQLFAEGDTCAFIKEELKVMEIYVSDVKANGALGEENEKAFSTFVLDMPMPCCSMDIPEDIHMDTDYGIDHMVALSGLGQVDSRHGYRSCDEEQSGLPGLKVFGVASEDMEDMEDEPDGLEADSLDEGIITWAIDMEDMEDEPDGLEADSLDKGIINWVVDMEDMEDKPDGLERNSWGIRFINWVIGKILCFGVSRH